VERQSMSIKVAEIPWSPKGYQFERNSRWLEENMELYGYEASVAGPLEVKAEGYRFSDSVHFTVRVDCHLRAACARCLKEFDYELSGTFKTVFKPGASDEFEEESDEDFTTAHIVGGEVDLEPLVIEFLKLEIPMRFLCREDCKGLCPVCGEDKNSGACRCEREAKHG